MSIVDLFIRCFMGWLRYRRVRWALATVMACISLVSTAQPKAYLIEAEAFQFKGSWIVEKNRDGFGGNILHISGGNPKDSLSDALTLVDIKAAARYFVWVRSVDYVKQSGVRTFRLSIDGQPLKVSGKHGRDGLYWEKVQALDLEKKPLLIRLHGISRDYARCDGVLLLMDSTVDPNKLDRIAIGKFRRNPMPIKKEVAQHKYVLAPLAFNKRDAVVASIHNSNIRISFLKSGAGNNAIKCKTELYTQGHWQHFFSDTEDHRLMLLSAAKSKIDFADFYPRWDNITSKSYFEWNSRKYAVIDAQDRTNPFCAGEISDAIAVRVFLKDKKTIEVHYVTKGNIRITGYWHLPEKGNYVEARFICKPAKPGSYSFVFAPFQGMSDASISNVLLPPMFQYKRLPSSPKMLVSSMMQQPFSMAEVNTSDGKVTEFICADLSQFNKDWGSAGYAPIGFAIKNVFNEVQPVAFSPVMGMKDAGIEAGEVLDRRFILGMLPAGIDSALNYISDNIFKVRDYRKQATTSLTDALFNMSDLMKNKKFGGWSDSLKGFYDIEGNPKTVPTVVQAAPLAVIASAIIARDENLYISRALPTIEFTLSRSGYRWAKALVPTGYNKSDASLKLNPFDSQFNTTNYTGINQLLGGLNPWLRQIALPGNSLRKTKGYGSTTLPFVEALAAYKLTKERRWKDSAIVMADKYIQSKIYTNTGRSLGRMPFYNTKFYAPWWDLIDLFELTGEKKYLEAAKYGATQTLAGIRTFPAVRDGDQVIHSGGAYEGNTTLWWKGKKKYRLGFPRVSGDVLEKKLPSWIVSPVGLGFEQPTTYFLTQKGKRVRPVYMSNWAPHLLRLFEYTHSPIYKTYARNAVIGRFSNYPGYYATGYTDIPMQDSFPYKGPDVSSIYYHHIPAHLTFTWDFLVAEFISATNRKIDFPYSKQEGFVWFNNRIYSGAGRIFDNKAALWMKKGLVKVDSPEINYLTAVSDEKFWMITHNEADHVISTRIEVDPETGIRKNGKIAIYDADRKIAEQELRGYACDVVLPAKSIRAYAVPTDRKMSEITVPVLNNGFKVLDIGDPFGKVFLFRIRSPYGWDSMYGFAETGPLKKASFSMTCNNMTKVVHAYPYECSFLKFNVKENIKVKVVAQMASGKKVEREVVFEAN